MIEQFIRYLNFEKHYSVHTVDAYRTDIRSFHEFISDVFSTFDITLADHKIIRRWVVALTEQNLSARSINRKISALKSFYNYLLHEGKVENNPVEKVTMPKMSKRLTPFIPQSSMQEISGEILPENVSFTKLRNTLIIEMLYATGMRRFELTQLKECDVDFNRKNIKILGKGGKVRFIPIFSGLEMFIEGYRKAKQAKGFSSSPFDYFMVTDQGKPINVQFVYRKVSQHLACLKNLDKRSPHVIRHTFATHLMDKGADINAVKELLGHSGLATTQVYVHNTIEKLKNTYIHAHPRAQ